MKRGQMRSGESGMGLVLWSTFIFRTIFGACYYLQTAEYVDCSDTRGSVALSPLVVLLKTRLLCVLLKPRLVLRRQLYWTR